MRFPYLVPGVFLRRENRFRVTVEVEGRLAAAHLPNSGRLHELLWPGRRVFLHPRRVPGRKTAYDLLLVEVDGRLVSVDARLPPRLFLEAWRAGRLPWLAFSPEWEVHPEPRCGSGRLDLLLRHPRHGQVWIETKSVTWVEEGTAYFPDAPTERGRRHLACLVQKRREGYRTLVVFIVQREDARRFQPHPADPEFPAALAQAHAQGVEVYAFSFRVSLTGMVPHGPVPVELYRVVGGT